MVFIPVTCPDCKSENVGRNGHDQKGVQRYLCRNAECSRKTFALEYTYIAYEKGIKQKVLDMTVSALLLRKSRTTCVRPSWRCITAMGLVQLPVH